METKDKTEYNYNLFDKAIEDTTPVENLIQNSTSYVQLIISLGEEFLKVYDTLIIKPQYYTEKSLKLSLAMNITPHKDYFFTICKNKSNYKYYTSIKGVISYLHETDQKEFYLRLNEGYELNYIRFNVFGVNLE